MTNGANASYVSVGFAAYTATTPENEESASLTFSHVNLIDESRQDVTILQVEVVMRSEDVGRDDRSELAIVLLAVRPVTTFAQHVQSTSMGGNFGRGGNLL